MLAARRRSIDLTSSMIAAYSNDNRSNAPYVQSDQSRMAARRLGWDSSFLSRTDHLTYSASSFAIAKCWLQLQILGGRSGRSPNSTEASSEASSDASSDAASSDAASDASP